MLISRISNVLNPFALICLIISGFWCPDLVAQSQKTGKVSESIATLLETHPYRAGIFRIRPLFTFGTAYDSNAFSTALTEIDDYYTAVSPGISAAVKFGRRGYIVVQEDLNFVTYSDQDALNDLYNSTSARAGFGGNRILVEFSGSASSRLARVNEEFDQPANQNIKGISGSFFYKIRRTSEISFTLSQDRFRYSAASDAETELPLPPDTDIQDARFQWLQDAGQHFQLTAEVASVQTDFKNGSKSDGWRFLGGFRFTGNQLLGHAAAGYGRTEQSGSPFRDLLIDADVYYRPRTNLSIGIYARRIRTVSALSDDGFRLLTEAGPRICIPLKQRLFADAGFLFGSNQYEDSTLQPSLTNDRFKQLDAGINISLPYSLVLRTGLTYQERDSNNATLNKDRFTLNIGIALDVRRSSRVDPGSCSPVSIPH